MPRYSDRNHNINTRSDIPEWQEESLRDALRAQKGVRQTQGVPYTYDQRTLYPNRQNRFLQNYFQKQKIGIARPHLNESQRFLSKSARPIEQMHQRYMNPYLEGELNTLMRHHSNQWLQKTLPSIQQESIGRGQFHSGARRLAQDRAYGEATEGLGRAYNSFLHHGHERSQDIHARERERERGLAREQQELGRVRQGSHVADLQGQLEAGERLRQQRAYAESLRHQQHQEAQGHLPQRVANYTAAASMLPQNIRSGSETTTFAPPVQPSTMSQIGATLMGMAGAPRARGGMLNMPRNRSYRSFRPMR